MRRIKIRKYFLTIKESKVIIDKSLAEIPGIEKVFQRRKLSLQTLEIPFKEGVARVYYLEGEPVLVGLPDGDLLPFLTAVERFNLPLPRVIVDLGAVRPIANGADVMGPGVKEVEGSFNEGDLVAVVDERLRAVIALGRALRPSSEARERGKTIKNIHHAGDPLWRAVSLR